MWKHQQLYVEMTKPYTFLLSLLEESAWEESSVFFWNSDNSHRLKFLLLQKVITQWMFYKDYNRISIEFIIDN